jgi:hypothetical protein
MDYQGHQPPTVQAILQRVYDYRNQKYSKEDLQLLVEGCDEEKKNTLILTMIVAENNSTEDLDSMKEALESMTPEEKVCWVLGEEYTEEEERKGEKDVEGEGEREEDDGMNQSGGADEYDGRGESVRKRMGDLNLGS